MEIKPIGEESLGVRSMCIYVETKDVRILFDAGVSLAPRRFGLPPHPVELERVREVRAEMLKAAASADVVTVSHYHRDHFTPWYPSQYMAADWEVFAETYGKKKVLAKSPEDLNWSQKRRHYGFVNALSKVGAEAIYADGKEFKFGDTAVVVSPPMWHGPAGSKTGKVVAFAVADGEETFAFVPDVEGPVEREPVEFVKRVRASVVVVGGSPTYLGWDLEKAVRNLVEIVDAKPRVLVLAHHLLRDLQWREKVSEVFAYAEKRGVEVATYAKILGKPEELLEASRPRLFDVEKPDGLEEEQDEVGDYT